MAGEVYFYGGRGVFFKNIGRYFICPYNSRFHINQTSLNLSKFIEKH